MGRFQRLRLQFMSRRRRQFLSDFWIYGRIFIAPPERLSQPRKQSQCCSPRCECAASDMQFPSLESCERMQRGDLVDAPQPSNYNRLRSISLVNSYPSKSQNYLLVSARLLSTAHRREVCQINRIVLFRNPPNRRQRLLDDQRRWTYWIGFSSFGKLR